jgi:thiol-disulfide isomerase/thioredoxin
MHPVRRVPTHHVLATAVVVLGVLGAACTGGGSDGSPTTSPSGATGGSLLPATPDALPTYDLATFRQLLGQLEGKPVVVNIWASWCGPCIAEAPHLAALSKETKGKVQFVGVDIIDQRPAARAFIHRYGWTYPSVFDPTEAIHDGLGVVGQPATLVFDPSGKQVFIWSGAVTEDVLRTELHTLGAI